MTSPDDPEALAEAVRTLLADPALAARLGANGREYVQQNLSWPVLVADWLGQLEAGTLPSSTN